MTNTPTLFTGHKGAIYTLQPVDNKHFLSAGSDGWVVKWNIDQPTEALALIQVGAPVFSLLRLPINNQFLVGTGSGNVHVVDTTSKKEVKNLQLHQGAVYQMLHLPTLNLVITTGNDGLINLLHATTFEVTERFQFGLGKIRAACVFQERVALGFESGDIILFNPLSGAIDKQNVVHAQGVTALNCVDNQLISGAKDAHLCLLNSDLQTLDKVPAHNYAIYQIAMQPNYPSSFATASRDKSIKFWRIENENIVFQQKLDAKSGGHKYSVNFATWLTDNYLVSAGDDRNALGWTADR